MTELLVGFGNHFSTEAVAGALPVGRNSPQKVPFGLYAEQLSGTAFTAPRGENRRSWLYRLRPAASHAAFERVHSALDAVLRAAPFRRARALRRIGCVGTRPRCQAKPNRSTSSMASSRTAAMATSRTVVAWPYTDMRVTARWSAACS